MICEVYLMKYMPVEIAIGIFMTLVLLLIAANSLILDEKSTILEVISVIIGYVGVLYLMASKYLWNGLDWASIT